MEYDYSFTITTTEWKILGEVLGGMVLGGIVGFEREMKNKAAGLRTHMIVCSASVLLVNLSNLLIGEFLQAYPDRSIKADPTHVIVAIISGIAFIGAGTIIRQAEGGTVGLTTASSLLFTTAIGMGIAIGKYSISILLAFLLIGVMWGVGKFESLIKK